MTLICLPQLNSIFWRSFRGELAELLYSITPHQGLLIMFILLCVGLNHYLDVGGRIIVLSFAKWFTNLVHSKDLIPSTRFQIHVHNLHSTNKLFTVCARTDFTGVQPIINKNCSVDSTSASEAMQLILK